MPPNRLASVDPFHDREAFVRTGIPAALRAHYVEKVRALRTRAMGDVLRRVAKVIAAALRLAVRLPFSMSNETIRIVSK
jgi:hypothetical protein